ncbi:MAG: hypothetical protein IKH72_07320 [Firmicutes bacterium]|nr:hypothetical protein [Bacillota bacterium]
MKTYKASTGRELSRTTEILCMVFGVVMIGLGIFQRSVYAAVIGLVLLAAGAMSKSVTVSEEGIVTEYRFLVRTKREIWGWDEIKDIFCEYSSKHPGKVGIHFTKESLMARRLFFPRNLKDEIIELALNQNPNITVEDE